MPCSACGGGGSSASTQFNLNRRKFKPLEQRQQRHVYVSPQRAAQLRAYYANFYKKKKTLQFN
jgi:hypothetical protein